MLGGEETVARVLGELERLGVIRVEGGGPAGDRIALASDALTREWPTLPDGWTIGSSSGTRPGSGGSIAGRRT